MPSAFPFVGGAYTARSRLFDAQRCVNLYPEVSESGTSRSVSMLVGTPGLVPWLLLPVSGGVRGMLALSRTQAIAVAGDSVFRVLATGSAERLGSIEPGTAPVSLASNGSTVMIAAGSTGYWVDIESGLVTRITAAAFEGAARCGFLDGYFVWTKPDSSGQFQAAALYGTEIDALDFATAEGAPDALVSQLVDHRELWLFGETTTEVWFNAGATDFPFERIQGAFIEHGCAARDSVEKLDNTVYWLASDDRGQGLVLRAAGYQPQRISTHAVEHAIGQYSRIDDAVAFAYQQEGHSFYVLSFPSGDATWVYDAATNLWHERAWRDDYNRLHRIRPQCQMAFAGSTIVGDWETGQLYRYSLDAFDDAGRPLPAIRQCPHIGEQRGRLQFFGSLQVDFETGVGLPTGQGSDPQAMLQWSDDGGATWSNEVRASMGKIGERRARVRWRRLGKSRDRIFRVTVTDPVKRAIVGASLTASVGSS